MSNLRGRIVKLEQRRRGPVDWTDCPDRCHLPRHPMEVRPMDYRAGLRPFVPPEMAHEFPPEPTVPERCPTCGWEPLTIQVRYTEDWRAPA